MAAENAVTASSTMNSTTLMELTIHRLRIPLIFFIEPDFTTWMDLFGPAFHRAEGAGPLGPGGRIETRRFKSPADSRAPQGRKIDRIHGGVSSPIVRGPLVLSTCWSEINPLWAKGLPAASPCAAQTPPRCAGPTQAAPGPPTQKPHL